MVALCVAWCILEEGYKYMFRNVPALMSAEWETRVRRRSSQEMVALKDMVFIQETSGAKEREKKNVPITRFFGCRQPPGKALWSLQGDAVMGWEKAFLTAWPVDGNTPWPTLLCPVGSQIPAVPVGHLWPLLCCCSCPPHSSAGAMGLIMPPACPLCHLDPLSPLSLSL